MLHKAEGVGKEGKIKQTRRKLLLFSELVGNLKSIQSKRLSVRDQEAEKQGIIGTKQIYKYFLLLNFVTSILTPPSKTVDYATLILIQKNVHDKMVWFITHSTRNFSFSLALLHLSRYVGSVTANFICGLGTITIDSSPIVFIRLQNSECTILCYC